MYQQDTAAQPVRLEDYLRAISNKRWHVLVATLLALALGWLFTTNRTDSFTTEARVLLAPSPVGSTNSNLAAPNLEREREIILSNDTAADADQLVNFEISEDIADDLDVTFQPSSDVLRIELSGTDPDRISDTVNAIVSAYVDSRNTAATVYFDTRLTAINEEIAALEVNATELATTIAGYDNELASLRLLTASESRNGSIETLTSQRSISVTELGSVQVQLRDLRIRENAQSEESSLAGLPASVLQASRVPTSPEGLSSNLIRVMAAIAGFTLGLVIAFFADRLDNLAGSEAKVERSLRSSVLGLIPKLGLGFRNSGAAVVMLGTQRSFGAQRAREAYRRLRSSVLFAAQTANAKSIVVTSSHPGEGKSVTTANLAVAMANAGQRVAVISADMRRPTIEKLLGIEDDSGPGLSTFLGSISQDAMLETLHDIPNLFVLPCGPTPDNPGELLGSDRFRVLLEQLESQVDVILIDTPPISAAADTLVLSSAADGYLVVVDASKTTTDELTEVRAELERSGASVVGAILNKDRRQNRRWPFSRDRYAYEVTAAKREAPSKAAA